MTKHETNLSDDRMSFIMGSLLRAGVISSAVLVILGGILFFSQHPAEVYDYSVFKSEPEKLKSMELIIIDALNLRGRAVIQTGILVLIATPVLRVLFSLIYFLFEKDWIYVSFTIVVLVVLVNSLVTL